MSYASHVQHVTGVCCLTDVRLCVRKHVMDLNSGKRREFTEADLHYALYICINI